jgi:hypothetical protein
LESNALSAVFLGGYKPQHLSDRKLAWPQIWLDSDEDERKISGPARNLTIFYVHSAFSIGSVKPMLSKFHK